MTANVAIESGTDAILQTDLHHLPELKQWYGHSVHRAGPAFLRMVVLKCCRPDISEQIEHGANDNSVTFATKIV